MKTAASVRGNTQFDETILDGSLVAPPHTAGKLLPKELWPPVIDLLTVEGYETALGAALGDDLERADLTDCADTLGARRWRRGGDPALPEGVEALAQHLVAAPQELQRRLAQIGVVERADGDAAAQRLKVGQRLVSRQGDLWRWTAWRSPPMPPPGPRGGLPTEANRLADAEQLGERPRLGLQTMSPALGVGERLACKIVILARGRMRGFRLQRRRFRLGERTGRCLRQRSAPDHDRADGAARWRATGSRLAMTDISLFPRPVLKPLHFPDFVGFGATWSLDLHGVPLVLADQRARDRRSD